MKRLFITVFALCALLGISCASGGDLKTHEDKAGFYFEYPSFLEKSADANEDNIVASYQTPKAMTNINLSVEVFVFDNSAKKGAFELLKEQAKDPYITNWINDKTITNFKKDELKKIGATDGAYVSCGFSLWVSTWIGLYTKGSKVFLVQISYNPELNWEVVYEYVKKIADSFRIN